MRKHIQPAPSAVLRDSAMALARTHSAAARPLRPAGAVGRIPPECAFAILLSPYEKPTCFLSARDLAKRIHRDRAGAPLQRINATLYLPNEPGGRPMAKVWTLCDGAPHRFLGYCWLGYVQSPAEALEAALDAVQPRLFEVAA